MRMKVSWLLIAAAPAAAQEGALGSLLNLPLPADCADANESVLIVSDVIGVIAGPDQNAPNGLVTVHLRDRKSGRTRAATVDRAPRFDDGNPDDTRRSFDDVRQRVARTRVS